MLIVNNLIFKIDQLAKLTNNALNKPNSVSARSQNSTLQRHYKDKTDVNNGDNSDTMKRLLVYKRKMNPTQINRVGPSSLPRYNSGMSTMKRISKSIDHINTEHLQSDYGHRMDNLTDDEGTMDRRFTSNYLSASQNRINDISRIDPYDDRYDTFNGDRLRETLVSDDMSNIFQVIYLIYH